MHCSRSSILDGNIDVSLRKDLFSRERSRGSSKRVFDPPDTFGLWGALSDGRDIGVEFPVLLDPDISE